MRQLLFLSLFSLLFKLLECNVITEIWIMLIFVLKFGCNFYRITCHIVNLRQARLRMISQMTFFLKGQ